MITLLVTLLLLTLLFGCAFRLTGAVLQAVIWIFIKLPLTLLAWTIGLAFCCTLILIPLGMIFFKLGLGIIAPKCYVY